MAKEFLHKEGLTKLVENIKAWCKGVFLGKDATITKSSGTNKGVSVSIQGSVSEPSVSVSVTTGGVSGNNSGIVSGVEVKTYVDENAATKDTFKAATSSSNAVNGLVPAPSSANATKFLRGDGTWTTPPLATNDIDGLMSATDKTTLDQSVAMVTPITGEDGSCVLEVERNDGTYLDFPVPKVGSAKEADNALKLDDVSLNNIHEKVSFNSKDVGDTEGWYRIARSLSFANGPLSLILFLEIYYNNDSPESYVFSISNTYGDYFSITQLSGVASVRLIDKIRVVNSVSTKDYIYIDIHITPRTGRLNEIQWGIVGNAVAYKQDEVVFNPELIGVNVEFETVNGFKTNANIYEGNSALSEKYIQATKEISTSASNKGVSVALGGTVEAPTLSVTTTTGGVSAANSGVVSGAEVYKKNFSSGVLTEVQYGKVLRVSVESGLLISSSGANGDRRLLCYVGGYGYGTRERISVSVISGSKEVFDIYYNGQSERSCVYIKQKKWDLGADMFCVKDIMSSNDVHCQIVDNVPSDAVLASSDTILSPVAYLDELRDNITNGNITAAKATTADSANAIGGKGLNDLVQGGGTIKFIKVVTSLPASPSNDTLYLIKQ